MKLLTGTVRRWDSGAVAALARDWPAAEDDENRRGEERWMLQHIYDIGDQPDTGCLVIIADPAELRRIREMLAHEAESASEIDRLRRRLTELRDETREASWCGSAQQVVDNLLQELGVSDG